MKRTILMLASLLVFLSLAFSAEPITVHVDPESGVQSNGGYSLYLLSEDEKNAFYISVSKNPTLTTTTSAFLYINDDYYVPADLLWYRLDGSYLSPVMLNNLGSGFSVYAEIIDNLDGTIDYYLAYEDEQMQCFGGPEDLVWSALMDGKLDIEVYDEWGYFIDELHFVIKGNTKTYLNSFSKFMQNDYRPQF